MATVTTPLSMEALQQIHVELLAWDAFVLFQIGVWFWEYAHTFRMDWRLLRGKEQLRPSGICFLLARFALSALFVGQLLLIQNIGRIDCQAVWIVLVIAGTLAISSSNAIYCLRALAVWYNRLLVLVPIVSLWLAQVCIWFLDIISLNTRGQQLPVLGFSCSSFTAAKYSAIPFIFTMLVDCTATGLIIAKLWKRTKLPGAPTLRRLILQDAAIYCVASLGPSIAAPILFWVTDRIILRTLMVSFALLVHVILSSRAFISLHDAGPMFPGHSRTVIRNGELLDRDALDRFTAARREAWSGMGGGGCGHGPDMPTNLEAQRQVSRLYKHFRYPEQLSNEKAFQSVTELPTLMDPAASSASDVATLAGADDTVAIKSTSVVNVTGVGKEAVPEAIEVRAPNPASDTLAPSPDTVGGSQRTRGRRMSGSTLHSPGAYSVPPASAHSTVTAGKRSVLASGPASPRSPGEYFPSSPATLVRASRSPGPLMSPGSVRSRSSRKAQESPAQQIDNAPYRIDIESVQAERASPVSAEGPRSPLTGGRGFGRAAMAVRDRSHFHIPVFDEETRQSVFHARSSSMAAQLAARDTRGPSPTDSLAVCPPTPSSFARAEAGGHRCDPEASRFDARKGPR
ncbi:unnamed protein product [Parajaminaea phylloscopi]